MFDDGRVAVVQRTGYPDASRSHFLGTDIWSTAAPASTVGPGWLGRYLDTLPSPVDPLFAWSTVNQLPRALQANTVGVPSIPNPASYGFGSPNGVSDAAYAKAAATRIASHVPVANPQLSFVNAMAQAALATLDRVEMVATYASTIEYPETGLGQALKAVAGAIATEVGTHVFWVQAGGMTRMPARGQ